MGRSSRLAVGAVVAAVAAGQVAMSHLAAGVALALAAVLLLGETRPKARAASMLPLVLGAGLIVLRLAATPAAPAPLDQPPEGDGPWQLVVEVDGLAQGRQANRDAGHARGQRGPVPRGRDPAPVSGRRARRSDHRRGRRSGDAPGVAIWRVPPADRAPSGH